MEKNLWCPLQEEQKTRLGGPLTIYVRGEAPVPSCKVTPWVSRNPWFWFMYRKWHQITWIHWNEKKWSRNGSTVEPFSCPQDGPHLGTILVLVFPNGSTVHIEPFWLHFFQCKWDQMVFISIKSYLIFTNGYIQFILILSPYCLNFQY